MCNIKLEVWRSRSKFLLMSAVSILAFMVLSHPVQARQQQINLVVPFSAGGPTDAVARLIAPELGKALDATVVVENKTGAGGVIGLNAVARSAPDGGTLYFTASPVMTIAPHVMKMDLDPATALRSVAPILTYDIVVVSSNSAPFKNLTELAEFAKANPGKATFGSAGVGTNGHMLGEWLAEEMGVELSHVPYKGIAPAMNDVLGGQIMMVVDIADTARPIIDSKRARGLVMLTSERSPILPEVPTAQESGVDVVASVWFGLFAPADTPDAIVERYNSAVRTVLAQPDVQGRLSERGYRVWIGSPDDLASTVAKDRAHWGGVAERINLK